MTASPKAERRAHPRYPLATGVRFEHRTTGREMPARCVDISEGGMLMYVPATAPVQVGQPIRLDLRGSVRRELCHLADRPLEAKIVRVDREKLLSMGRVAVGVKFVRVDEERPESR